MSSQTMVAGNQLLELVDRNQTRLVWFLAMKQFFPTILLHYVVRARADPELYFGEGVGESAFEKFIFD